ncbi:sensory box histidine kinase/response regulator [Legionella steigerwaltii]|uniref:histidine kinase n=1 Tax=Legionella steigerwaltii TaxID=460 RepID=A0A378L914_9GAMM|nr:PAS domain S-box protein [Legionella steigerwaltii]KTD77520.1 sensory box histidine kinase/response regulator [Legionella steigerwaltii]STY22830.1 sensory box histidine kinase/response regulator [Legionella steigerwaltii]
MNNQLSYFLHLSSIIESMPDALVIIDNKGRIVLVNGQTEHLFGYARTELLGEYVERLMPERYRKKHVHHRDDYFVMPKTRSMGTELELFGIKKNGTEFPVEISLSPLKTDEGTFALAAVRDITIRKKAEAKFKSILEATPDCLVVINNEGKIVLVNNRTENLFGHKPNEVIGQYVECLIPKRFHKNHIGHRTNYFSEPRVRPMGAGLELYGQHKMGHEFPVEISLSPLETEEGLLALAAVRDISEQKQLEEQLFSKNKELELQNRLKTEFLANMSHDIRTPLTGLIGMSQLLENLVQDPQQKQYAQWLSDSGKQLLNMLNVILDTVSAENVNESAVHEELFELNQVTQEVLQLVRPSTITKGIDLKAHIDENTPPYLVSDHLKLRRILLNLLGNAIKFTQAGQITIEVKLLKRMKTHALLHFSVSDTGAGIPYTLQGKVFDKFFRGTPSRKGVYRGHGLGLHIAQSYANLLGGKILLTSEPGVGTTFYFDLLIKIGDSIPKQMLSNNKRKLKITRSEAKNKRPSNAPKLLLIEDNHIALLSLENIVNQAGFRYSSAGDGESALDLVKAETFDLIITDLGLPGLSGIELTRRIRKYEKEHHRIPVLIIGLTGHDEHKIKNKCIQAGMNAAFTKPLNSETLEKIKSSYLTSTQSTTMQAKRSTPKNKTKKLGLDLSDTEEELFKLDAFPLFDAHSALTSLGNNAVLFNKTLKFMIEQEIPNTLKALEKAYAAGEWETIEKLAHKMKGGLVYCGAFKLVHACQYLELYHKAGYVKFLEPLYKQLVDVIDETKEAINQWLLR